MVKLGLEKAPAEVQRLMKIHGLPVVYGKYTPGCVICGFGVRMICKYYVPAVVVFCESRRAVARLLWRFRAARRAVPHSSEYLHGHKFKKGSLRWLASFSGCYYRFGKKIAFTQPYLKHITCRL